MFGVPTLRAKKPPREEDAVAVVAEEKTRKKALGLGNRWSSDRL